MGEVKITNETMIVGKYGAHAPWITTIFRSTGCRYGVRIAWAYSRLVNDHQVRSKASSSRSVKQPLEYAAIAKPRLNSTTSPVVDPKIARAYTKHDVKLLPPDHRETQRVNRLLSQLLHVPRLRGKHCEARVTEEYGMLVNSNRGLAELTDHS